jgi:hypothetical protein
MATATTPPDDAYDAVHQAIAGLDDDHRTAVLQHFFERRTLEDIARDQHCSAVAVWKRIEKSKSDLKGALERVGFAAFTDAVLAAIQPVAAPPTLVSNALIAKAATLMPAVIVGGIAVKTFSAAAVAAFALALFLTGLGGGYFLRAHPPQQPQPRPEPVAVHKTTPTVAPVPTPTPPTTTPTAPPNVEPVKEPLLARLHAYALLLRQKPEAYKSNNRARIDALEKQSKDAWTEIRAQAYEEPAVFFAFLRAPENKDLLHDLLYAIADAGSLKYPPGIIDGLADLLATGTPAQRRETATLVTIQSFDSGGAGAALTKTCYDRLSVEKDPDVLGTLINQLHIRPDCNAKVDAGLDLLRTLWDNNTVWNVREQTLEALAKAKTPAGEALFLEKMDDALRGSNTRLQIYLPQILSARIPAIQPADEERYLPLFATAFRTVKETPAGLQYAYMALGLTLPKASIILADAQANAADPDTRAACERAVTLIRGGETRSDALFMSLMKKP